MISAVFEPKRRFRLIRRRMSRTCSRQDDAGLPIVSVDSAKVRYLLSIETVTMNGFTVPEFISFLFLTR
jgi:hypothetical protein